MPHPGRGFSQGLLAEGNSVWESVGNYGQSALRRYELGAGSVSAQAELAPEFFGEGICRVADGLWQLTWRERIALSWDAETLELREKIRYNREGWGMCAVGQSPVNGVAPLPDVVTSDGTSELVRRDPVTLEPREVLQVQGQRVPGLNDLTWQAAWSGPTSSGPTAWPGSTSSSARSPTWWTPARRPSGTGGTRRRS